MLELLFKGIVWTLSILLLGVLIFTVFMSIAPIAAFIAILVVGIRGIL